MRSIFLAALIALAGCSFDDEKSDMSFEVTNIDQIDNVNHLVVTLTLPDASTHTFQPNFGPQSSNTVSLALSSGSQIGAYSLEVDELDRNSTKFGTVTISGTLPLTGTVKVALPNPAGP